MKASEFIIHLQQMIEEHGDLPLALMEVDCESNDYCRGYNFIEIGRIGDIVELDAHDKLFDENDCQKLFERKVFLID